MKSFRQLLSEAFENLTSDSVVFTFGRFSPPTAGHLKLINKVISVAKQKKASPVIFASQTQDSKKNPLQWKDKVGFMKKLFKGANISNDKSANTPFKVLEMLNEKKVSNVTMVVGADRVREFKTNMQKFINKDLPNIKNFEVVSAGERDPDSEGVEGISASKMREFARNDDFKNFVLGLPKNSNKKLSKKIFDSVKKGLNVK